MTNRAVTIYGAGWCQDSQRIKELLGSHILDYAYIDVDQDKAGMAKVTELSGGQQTIPVLVFADGSHLVNPSNADVEAKLELVGKPPVDYVDLAIIGAGPTGLSAAIYSTREDISTKLYEKGAVGGLAGTTDSIENYPGFPEGVSGLDLADAMESQAKRFGAQFATGIEITGIFNLGRYKKLTTTTGDFYAKSVLIATGSTYSKLGVTGEAELTGHGVHYCATCDGPLYRGKSLIVIGGGNSAMQESLFLTKFAQEITIIVRGPQLKGTEVLIEKVRSHPQIKVVYNTATTEILGTAGRVSGIEALDSKNDKKVRFDAAGIFIFIGLYPNTAFLKDSIKLDDKGFVVVDKTFETDVPGVFAAGDVRSGATAQIASAVGEGVTAALMIREYLKELG